MTIDKSRISEVILASELAINERWNRGDVDGALEAYSEDVTYFDPLTERRLEGRAAVEAYFRQFFEGKLNILRNDLPNPQIIVSDSEDLVVATYNLLNFVSDGNGSETLGTVWNSTQATVQSVERGGWSM